MIQNTVKKNPVQETVTSVINGRNFQRRKKMLNNQTIKADEGKLKLSLVPTEIIRAIARVRMYGNAKYPKGGPDNWKHVEIQRYRDALLRHTMLYIDNPYGIDEESGLPHLEHIACNVAFLCELQKGLYK